jgi:hypothetical protein
MPTGSKQPMKKLNPKTAREANELLLAKRGLDKLQGGEPLTRAELAAVERAQGKPAPPPQADPAGWPEWAVSTSEAARVTRISRKTLLQHRENGAAGFNPDGRVNLWTYRKWLEGAGSKLLERTPSMENAKLRKMLAEAGLAELKLGRARGEVIQYAAAIEIGRDMANIIESVLWHLLTDELPPQLSGQSPEAIRMQMRAVHKKITGEIRQGMERRMKELSEPQGPPPAAEPPAATVSTPAA